MFTKVAFLKHNSYLSTITISHLLLKHIDKAIGVAKAIKNLKPFDLSNKDCVKIVIFGLELYLLLKEAATAASSCMLNW